MLTLTRKPNPPRVENADSEQDDFDLLGMEMSEPTSQPQMSAPVSQNTQQTGLLDLTGQPNQAGSNSQTLGQTGNVEFGDFQAAEGQNSGNKTGSHKLEDLDLLG